MKLLTIVSTVLGFLPVCVPVLNRRPRAKNRTAVTVFFFVTAKSRNRRTRVVFRHRASLPVRRKIFLSVLL